MLQMIIDDLNSYGDDVTKDILKVARRAAKSLGFRGHIIYDNYIRRWIAVW